jgi:hypothetical protein
MGMTHQEILDNASALMHGVKRITGPARLGADITEDIFADAQLALLDGRAEKFDSSRATAAAFCRMVGYQVALDKLRAMSRGGQFSGAYAGFGNAQLDADRGDDAPPINSAPAADVHKPKAGAVQDHSDTTGRAVRVNGASFGVASPTFADELVRADELAAMRAAVAEVLPLLSADELALWHELADGSFAAASYAERHGIAAATAHVRANRLRAKVSQLLRVAA